jgi:hypothetical protein
MPGPLVNVKIRGKIINTISTHCQKQQYAPYRCIPIQYGAKKQYAKQELKAPLLNDKAKQFIQQVCGNFLFLGRAVDSTLLCPISAIVSQSSKPTKDTMWQTLQLFNYLATQEVAIHSYHTSLMVLAVHSNACYLSEPKACSRAGGSWPEDTSFSPATQPYHQTMARYSTLHT